MTRWARWALVAGLAIWTAVFGGSLLQVVVPVIAGIAFVATALVCAGRTLVRDPAQSDSE